MEQLVQAMEEKNREQKRAKTVRTDYKSDLDTLTDWVLKAEVKVRDKTSQPQVLKESLQEIQTELPAMQDRLDKLIMNAEVICDNSQDPEEISLIKGNVNTLSEQINIIKTWIDEKKQQIGDCLDSWERFMTLYNTVMNWTREKQDFLKQPLILDSLADTKTKLHDYNVNVKSCKNMGKTLSEMSKELEHISENGSIGDLSDKMEEAETAKVEVEAQLLERNSLLHETSEEWEQCEKKLREVRSWLDKTKGALDAGAVKKKPLRDQLAVKEKTMADVSVQKTKISVSVEKLQVHFKCGLSGGETVVEAAEKLKRELDSMHGIVKQQSTELEAAIEQVEQYQQEILHLKQEVVSSEQKLRTISSPAYLPHDREAANLEQNELAAHEEVPEEEISNLQEEKEEIEKLTQDNMEQENKLIEAAESLEVEGEVGQVLLKEKVEEDSQIDESSKTSQLLIEDESNQKTITAGVDSGEFVKLVEKERKELIETKGVTDNQPPENDGNNPPYIKIEDSVGEIPDQADKACEKDVETKHNNIIQSFISHERQENLLQTTKSHDNTQDEDKEIKKKPVEIIKPKKELTSQPSQDEKVLAKVKSQDSVSTSPIPEEPSKRGHTEPQRKAKEEEIPKKSLIGTKSAESVDTLSSQDDETIGNIEVNIGIIGLSQTESLDESTNAVEIVAEVALSPDDNTLLSQVHDVASFDTDIHSELADSEIIDNTAPEFTTTSHGNVFDSQTSEFHKSTITTSHVGTREKKKLRKEMNVEVRSPENVSPALGASENVKFSYHSMTTESNVDMPFTSSSVDVQDSHTVVHSRTRSVIRQRMTKIIDGKEVEVIDYPDIVEENRQLSFGAKTDGNFSEIHTTPNVEITELSSEEGIPDKSIHGTQIAISPQDLPQNLGEIVEAWEHRSNINECGTETQVDMTIVQPVIHQVRKVKRVIRKVVIINGKEHVSESVIEEPEQVISSVIGQETIPTVSDVSGEFKSFSYGEVHSNRQVVVQSRRKITKTIKTVNGKVLVEEVETEPDDIEIVSIEEPSISFVQYERARSDPEQGADDTHVTVEHPEEITTDPSTEQVVFDDNKETIVKGIDNLDKPQISLDFPDADCQELAVSKSNILKYESTTKKEPPTIQEPVSTSEPVNYQKNLDVNKKSISVGSDSSDSAYTNVQVKVTVPEEISLSVDIKKSKDKKKSKKSKKNTDDIKPEEILVEGEKLATKKENIVTETGTSFISPNVEETKTLISQFLDAESSHDVHFTAEFKHDSNDKTLLENKTTKFIQPETHSNVVGDSPSAIGIVDPTNFDVTVEELQLLSKEDPDKSDMTLKTKPPTKSKKSSSVISVETTVSPSEKGEKAVILKVSKKDKRKHKKEPSISNINDEVPITPRKAEDETVTPCETSKISKNDQDKIEMEHPDKNKVTTVEIKGPKNVDVTIKTVVAMPSEKEKKSKSKRNKKKTKTGTESDENIVLIDEEKNTENKPSDFVSNFEKLSEPSISQFPLNETVMEENVLYNISEGVQPITETIITPHSEKKEQKRESNRIEDPLEEITVKETKVIRKGKEKRKLKPSELNTADKVEQIEQVIPGKEEFSSSVLQTTSVIESPSQKDTGRHFQVSEDTNPSAPLEELALPLTVPDVKEMDSKKKRNLDTPEDISQEQISPEKLQNSLQKLHNIEPDHEIVEVDLNSDLADTDLAVIGQTIHTHMKEIPVRPQNTGTNKKVDSKEVRPSDDSSYVVEIKTSIICGDNEPIVTVLEGTNPPFSTSITNEDSLVNVSVTAEEDYPEKENSFQTPKADGGLMSFIEAEINHSVAQYNKSLETSPKSTTEADIIRSSFDKVEPQIDDRKFDENATYLSESTDYPRYEADTTKKETSEDLIQTIKERIVNINTPSFVGLLSDLDNTMKRRDINHNLDVLKNSSEEERESIIITTTILISEYLETITYIIINSKKYNKENTNSEEQLKEITRLLDEVSMLKEDIKSLKGCGEKNSLVAALETQSEGVQNILENTRTNVDLIAREREEALNDATRILNLVNSLMEEIDQLEKDQSKSAEKKLNKLDELDILNTDYDSQVCLLLRKYPNQPELFKSAQMLLENEEQLAALRTSLIQSLSLAQEYKDTLVELENVSEVAKTIVASRVNVPSLQDLQNEMQKERKFFISLSHCRSILESLESSLDQETRDATAEQHNRLHNTASDILESAGERAVALALGASRWTLIEQGLTEERGWLRVAQERIPNLSGVSSSDYHQYLSLYQSLISDTELHSARVWKLLESAHTLQGLISCNSLEESCDTLRTAMALLEDRVSDGVKKLTEFKEQWSSFDLSFQRLNKWLDVVIPNCTPPLNIQIFWELKAEYEVFKGIYDEMCEKFKNSLAILLISDSTEQKIKVEDLKHKWAMVTSLLKEAEVSFPSDVNPVEKLNLIEKRLQQMESIMNSFPDMALDAELDLYIGKLQVLKEGATDIENELLRYSLGPACERRRLGILQSRTRTLKTQATSEHSAASSLRERLIALRVGMTRASRIQNKSLKVLDQWEPSIDGSEDVLRQALVNVKGVVKTLSDERVELSWLRETLGRLPVCLKARLSLASMEREMLALSESQLRLGKRAEELLSEILSRLKLWDSYGMKLDSVRSTVREADYMMELLRVDVGPIDLPRIVKASTRLQGVKESLVEREGGLEELRCAGRALEQVVRPEVGERLRAEVREEEAAWARAEAGLGELAGKYQRAAKLWSQYREAVEAAQPPTFSENLIPQEWEKREEAVKEAERLAEEIAGETGVAGILSQEVSTLSRRLTEAKEISPPSPTKPTSPAIKAQLLKTLQEKLNPKSDGNNTEQLIALRNSLLELGRTDAQINCVTDSSPAEDISVVDLLQLWEKVFRDTFQEYHRLSSKLVKSEDSPNVLNVWKDYLDHVNQFLDSGLPHQYHELHEQNHLCQVHHTVLSSQRSLLPSEDAALDNDAIQQFSLLTNMHNEALARIMEKQSEVQKRINLWDKYRQEQSDLLDWLKKTENERNQLKLRYIHSKTIGKTIAKIEELLKRMSVGESMEIALKEQLHTLLPYCDDESVSSSLQIEHASISHRLSNLHAALLTWKDYLLKVKSNIESYENLVDKIQNSLEDIQNVLAAEKKNSNETPNELEHKLQTVMAVTNKVKDLSKQVVSLEDAKDILKDSLSPADLKSMTQRCWLFTQQQHEYEHQLSMAEQIISDKLQLTEVYEQRCNRFLTWISTLLSRLSFLPSDANSALTLVERELRGELSLKKSEADWLVSTGNEIGKDELAKKVNTAWTDLQDTLNNTATKLSQITKNIPRLEEEMDNLRIWLHKMESKLSSPISIKHATKKYINSQVKEHEAIEQEIEKESSKIKDVLNLCEYLLNDCESCHITLDTEGITLAMANLEKRWKEMCLNSSERKSTLLSLWPILEKAQSMAKEQKSWLSVLEKRVEELEKQLCLSSLEALPNVESDILKLVAEMKNGGTEGLNSLDSMYLSLHREYKLPDEMLKIPEELLKQWEALESRAEALTIDARSKGADRERWQRSAARAVSAMAKIDAVLTLAEVQESSQQLQEIQTEFESEAPALEEADVSGLQVMKWCSKADILKTQSTIDEYQNLWKNISERLKKIRTVIDEPEIQKHVHVEDQCVEVNTLRFETDQSIQVDTLGWSPPIARKEAFCEELIRTTRELDELLLKLSDLGHLETQTEITKCIGECESNYELAKHLSETLVDQCSASQEEALIDQIKTLGDRFDTLRNRALTKQNQIRESSARGRLTCPLCSNKNWQQLDNDLWRLEQWLQYAEGSLTSQPSNPPSSIEQLEDVIQDQRELLLDLDSHRSLVVSMNIVGTHLAEHSDDELKAKELRSRLSSTNMQWELVCELATAWQSKLQTALLQNEEFHDTMSELTEWLEKTESTIRQAEPIDLTDPTHLIQAKYNKFKEMREDVERCEARVRSLEEAAKQVLKEDRVVERLGRLRIRLISLSRLIATYIHRLSATLGHHPGVELPELNILSQQLLDPARTGSDQSTNGEEVDTSTLVRCHRFLGRVMRASVPISAFLLLLLGAASFIPAVDQDFACANSFLYNMAPVLRYPNGRPPI